MPPVRSGGSLRSRAQATPSAPYPRPPDLRRRRVLDFDWFEDRMWRKPRVNSIALHFITAFLDDLQLKGEAVKAEYLAVPSEDSDGAKWPSDDKRYDAVSEGGTNPNVEGLRQGPPGRADPAASAGSALTR